MLQFWVWWIKTRARAEELCSCKEKQRGGGIYNIYWDLRKCYYTFFLLNLGENRCGRDLQQSEHSPWMAQLCVLLTLSLCSSQALPAREAPQHLQALFRAKPGRPGIKDIANIQPKYPLIPFKLITSFLFLLDMEHRLFMYFSLLLCFSLKFLLLSVLFHKLCSLQCRIQVFPFEDTGSTWQTGLFSLSIGICSWCWAFHRN